MTTLTTMAERIAGARWVLISDVDGTLIGDLPDDPNPHLDALGERLAAESSRIVFGVASGRTARSAVDAMAEHGLPAPAIVIGRVGTEIAYGPDLVSDADWVDHISFEWDRPRLVELLDGFDSLRMQEEAFQTPHKASYYVTDDFGDETLSAVREHMAAADLRANVVFSHARFLDFIPRRAGKGKALRFLSGKWQKPLSRFVTCGNSGNDADMLKGDVKGVVVGNYSPELDALRGDRDLYFADAPLAGGVLEGMRHYGLLD